MDDGSVGKGQSQPCGHRSRAYDVRPSAVEAAQAGQEPREPSAERPQDIWRYLQDVAAREHVSPDLFITYSGVAGQTHRIDIFEPTPDGAPPPSGYPGLVLFHGGAWREGAPVQFYRQARAIAEAGFVVALPEYSIQDRDGTTPLDAVTDAFLAWSMIHASAQSLAIAPDRLFAGGASAGGQMAAALATLERPAGIEDHVLPAGLILFEPVIDNGPGGYGHARVQDYWQRFSPLHNVGGSHPDTLVLVGDSDALIPVETAERYCGLVRAAHATCVVRVFENAGHAWFNHDPTGYADTLSAALTTLKAWARPVEE